MKSFRSSLSLSLVALVATLAGCGVEAGGPEAESASTEQAATAAATDVAVANAEGKGGPRFAGRHAGGPGFLLMAALHEDLGLSAEQRTTLEGLLPKHDADGERPAPDKSHSVALAAAIRSGKIDAAQLAPKAMVKDDAAHEARKVQLAKALDTLHATLTTEQRQKLVASLKTHDGKAHEGRRPEGRGPKADGEHEGAMRGPLGGLLAGIDLTAEQKQQLKQKLEAARPAKPSEAEMEAHKKQFEAMRNEHEARLASFAADKFDATAFLAAPAKPEGDAPWAKMRDHHADELAIVVSVLQPAQREQLAAKIEQGPTMGHGMKPMRR